VASNVTITFPEIVFFFQDLKMHALLKPVTEYGKKPAPEAADILSFGCDPKTSGRRPDVHRDVIDFGWRLFSG
jgi:hypothetical protein